VNANGVPLVIFGSGDPDCAVYALNANTGATLWRVASLKGGLNDFGAGTVISPPGRNGIADGMAYVPGKDRILYGIDLTTGKLKWTFDYGAATGTSHNGGRSTAALAGRTLIFGTPVGVAAVDAVTGKQIWLSENTGPSGSVCPNPGGKPVVAAGTAKAGSAAVRAVDVAVQMNGAAGPWWNAARRSWQAGPAWNHATLSGTGSQRNWTFGVPAPRQGA